MATMITDDCIGCGRCAEECPNEAISLADDGFMYRIAAERCTECVGFHRMEMCQAVCPVDCCLPDPARPETEDVLRARAEALHPRLAGTLVLSPATSRFRQP